MNFDVKLELERLLSWPPEVKEGLNEVEKKRLEQGNESVLKTIAIILRPFVKSPGQIEISEGYEDIRSKNADDSFSITSFYGDHEIEVKVFVRDGRFSIQQATIIDNKNNKSMSIEPNSYKAN